jgi:hypothetical protein
MGTWLATLKNLLRLRNIRCLTISPRADERPVGYVSGATITGVWVGDELPPFGSGVTRISVTPWSLGGSPMSPDPREVTLKRTFVGTGAPRDRFNHIS